MIAYTFFHMLGMSSACTNPFLYGFLNDNFLKEFKTFFHACRMIKLRRISHVNPNIVVSSTQVSRDMAGSESGQISMEMATLSGRWAIIFSKNISASFNLSCNMFTTFLFRPVWMKKVKVVSSDE